jgi:hypothetical protein
MAGCNKITIVGEEGGYLGMDEENPSDPQRFKVSPPGASPAARPA